MGVSEETEETFEGSEVTWGVPKHAIQSPKKHHGLDEWYEIWENT